VDRRRVQSQSLGEILAQRNKSMTYFISIILVICVGILLVFIASILFKILIFVILTLITFLLGGIDAVFETDFHTSFCEKITEWYSHDT
jgi:hypothetical protein